MIPHLMRFYEPRLIFLICLSFTAAQEVLDLVRTWATVLEAPWDDSKHEVHVPASQKEGFRRVVDFTRDELQLEISFEGYPLEPAADVSLEAASAEELQNIEDDTSPANLTAAASAVPASTGVGVEEASSAEP